MEIFLNLILKSGETGLKLGLYIILPIMVIMMAIMKVLEERHILYRVSIILAPITIFAGLPGIGIFAVSQVLFVSFVAPLSTLLIINKDDSIDAPYAASTLAAILSMSQANATMPLSTVGLDFWFTFFTSIIGGITASFIAFKLSGGSLNKKLKPVPMEYQKRNLFSVIVAGGEEGLNMAMKITPMLIIAVFCVNLLKEINVISIMEKLISPVFGYINMPVSIVLPIVTKYIAGGTAMMGVTVQLIKDGALSAHDLNQAAGFMINPFDPVGFAILISAGNKIAGVGRIAAIAAVCGIIIRGIIHFIYFS